MLVRASIMSNSRFSATFNNFGIALHFWLNCRCNILKLIIFDRDNFLLQCYDRFFVFNRCTLKSTYFRVSNFQLIICKLKNFPDLNETLCNLSLCTLTSSWTLPCSDCTQSFFLQAETSQITSHSYQSQSLKSAPSCSPLLHPNFQMSDCLSFPKSPCSYSGI